MGFARPILHGHCTLAMIAHELLRATGREPRRLLGSFRTPLELPNDVSLEVSGAPESGSTAFRLVAAGEADRPFVEGEWVGAEQGGPLQ